MESRLDPDRSLLLQLLWTTDPSTQSAIGLVLLALLLALAFVYGPLILALVRVALLERSVRACFGSDNPEIVDRREEVSTLFSASALASQWTLFQARWQGARRDGQDERAPVRLMDILDEEPLLQSGARQRILPALPGVFLAVGVLGTFVGLIAAISQLPLATAQGERLDVMARFGAEIGLALRPTLWGLLLSISALVLGRGLEGGFDRYTESLDRWVGRAFGAISSAELTNEAAHAQRDSLEQIGGVLSRFTSDLTERLDRGLQRIERSTAAAANLVSEEQRGVLQTVVRELSLQVQQGVEQHLTALHEVLERSVEHQSRVTGGIQATFEQMETNALTHHQVTETLEAAALAVERASSSISDTAREFSPVLEHLRETGTSLHQTSTSIESTQLVVARTAEGVRYSLEHAAAAMNEQREFIEAGLGEIRMTLDLLSTGLGENLAVALRNVDDALSQTVGRLRETISDSNDTIDRMAGPVRAAEGATREMHTALDRVRNEVVALGEWLGQAIKPVRGTLGQLEEKTAEMTRALNEFGDHTRAVDKTMDALRSEIHEEGRRLRGSSSELGRLLQRNADAVHAFDVSIRHEVPAGERAAEPEPRTPEARSSALGTGPPESKSTPEAFAPARGARLAKLGALDPGAGRSSDPALPRPGADDPAVSEEAQHLAETLSRTLMTASAPEIDEASAGRMLGPDPYARLAAPRPPAGTEPDAGARGPADELSLSGLLGAHSGPRLPVGSSTLLAPEPLETDEPGADAPDLETDEELATEGLPEAEVRRDDAPSQKPGPRTGSRIAQLLDDEEPD